MGLFGFKKKELVPPEGGCYVLRCKACGQELYVPASKLLADGTRYVFGAKEKQLIWEKDGNIQTLSDSEFFDVDTAPSGVGLDYTLAGNLGRMYSHLVTHYDPLYLNIMRLDPYHMYTFSQEQGSLGYVLYTGGTAQAFNNAYLSGGFIPGFEVKEEAGEEYSVNLAIHDLSMVVANKLPLFAPLSVDEAKAMRGIGEKLAASGGFSALQNAYMGFNSKYPMYGTALSQAWDGVGGWAD